MTGQAQLIGRGAVLVFATSLLLALAAVPSSVAAPSSVPTQAVGLALTIIPPKLPADNGTYPAVVVSLVDSNGLPSAALSDIIVYLTSSQTNIAKVPNSVTISVGSEYVVANAVTTQIPGYTTITASSYGLSSSYALLITATPSGFPSKLEVFVSPSDFLRRADIGTVRVELVDGTGSPSKAITPVAVLLSSSNVSIASLDQGSLTINPGDIYATGTFHTSTSSGPAVITASSTGYVSGGALVTVVPSCSGSCGPSELLLKPVPGTGHPLESVLPADGLTYSALEVGLATSVGNPAVSSSDTIVQLSSNDPNIISVPSFITIPAGSISVLVPLTTSSLQGSSSITAIASSLLPGNLSVRTVIPAPSVLQAYIAPPSTFVTPVDSSPILVIQLQDSNGNPARARSLTDVTVTSSNTSVVSGPIHLSIGVGLDYASTHLAASGSGQIVLTATSQGLSSSHVNLQLAKSPLVDQLSASLPHGVLYLNETLSVTLSVSFLGEPLVGASVTWTATGGSVLPTSDATGMSGQASTVFTPSSAGTANVTASGISPQTGPFTLSYVLSVEQAPSTGTTMTTTTTTKTVRVTTTVTTTATTTSATTATTTATPTATTTIATTATTMSTTTATTTVTSSTTTTATTTSTASTFAFAALGSTVVVILTVAALTAWVLRGRRP